MTALRIVDDHLELANIGSNTHAQIDTELTKLAGIESGATADQTKADIDGLGLSHDSLVDVSANDHHNELHSIASHNDTSATGAQLDTLTDNSIADTLHRHSELVASDGSPDPALWIDASGDALLQTAGDTRIYIQTTAITGGAGFDIKKADNSWGWRVTGEAAGFKVRDHLNGLNKFYIEDGATGNIWFDNIKNVGIGTAAPATSAKLELSSTTGALLLTRMTTVQKNALTAVNGMLVYDSTLNKFQGYENGAWTSLI